MTVAQRTLTSSYPISLRETVLSHGWVNLAPCSYDADRNRFRRIERGSAGLITVTATQKDARRLMLRIAAPSLTPADIESVKKRMARCFFFSWDPSMAIRTATGINPAVAEYIASGGGRFLRGATFFEDFAKTLATVNASWSFTQKMVTRLVVDLGGGAFPSPDEVLSAGSAFLRETARFGYRAEVLVSAIHTLLERGLMTEEGRMIGGSALGYETLLSIKGIGRYAAAHLSVLAGDFSRIPIDSEVRPYCETRFGITEKEIPAFFANWNDYAFLGYKLGRIVEKRNWIG